MNEITRIRELTGLNKMEFAKWYDIPYRTIQNWEDGSREAPPYVIALLKRAVMAEFVLVDDYGNTYKPASKKRRIYVPTDATTGNIIAVNDAGKQIVIAYDEITPENIKKAIKSNGLKINEWL